MLDSPHFPQQPLGSTDLRHKKGRTGPAPQVRKYTSGVALMRYRRAIAGGDPPRAECGRIIL
jgi:hypothetical protein